MPKRKIPVPEPITELETQLEQFRATYLPRTKLPEWVWQSAVELARCHGIYVVAHSLRLDYATLKRQVSGGSAPRRKRTQPAFVELIGAARAGVDEYVIEFESGRGPKMRIHWKAVTPPDWAGLLRTWGSRQGFVGNPTAIRNSVGRTTAPT